MIPYGSVFSFSVFRSKATCYYSRHVGLSRFQPAFMRQAYDAVGRGLRFLLPLDTTLGENHGRYGGLPTVSRGLVGFSPGGRGGVPKSSSARSTRRARIFGRPCRTQITRHWRPCQAVSFMVRTFADLPLVCGCCLSLRGRKPLLAPTVLTSCSIVVF